MSWPTRLVSRVHDWLTRRKMERVFGRRVDAFSYGSDPYERARQDAVATAAAERPVRHVLELGCGEGFLTERLASCCSRVTAVDISPTALARARGRLARHGGQAAAGDRVAFVEANIRSWAPPSAGFDLIVASDVLNYLGERYQGLPLVQEPEFLLWLERLAGWLAPDGRLLLAHGYVGPAERQGRVAYRTRLERLGLVLEREWEAGAGLHPSGAACLLSLLRKSDEPRRGGLQAAR